MDVIERRVSGWTKILTDLANKGTKVQLALIGQMPQPGHVFAHELADFFVFRVLCPTIENPNELLELDSIFHAEAVLWVAAMPDERRGGALSAEELAKLEDDA